MPADLQFSGYAFTAVFVCDRCGARTTYRGDGRDNEQAWVARQMATRQRDVASEGWPDDWNSGGEWFCRDCTLASIAEVNREHLRLPEDAEAGFVMEVRRENVPPLCLTIWGRGRKGRPRRSDSGGRGIGRQGSPCPPSARH